MYDETRGWSCANRHGDTPTILHDGLLQEYIESDRIDKYKSASSFTQAGHVYSPQLKCRPSTCREPPPSPLERFLQTSPPWSGPPCMLKWPSTKEERGLPSLFELIVSATNNNSNSNSNSNKEGHLLGYHRHDEVPIRTGMATYPIDDCELVLFIYLFEK
jgi:hypothetical protein